MRCGSHNAVGAWSARAKESLSKKRSPPITARSSIIAVTFFAACIHQPRKLAAGTVLGTAETFAILGASAITNTGATTINGNVGLYPGTSLTGTGTIALTGSYDDANAAAQQAQLDAAAAYKILSGLQATTNLTGQDLGGLTLTPGVYDFSTSAQLTGTLTLDLGGASNEDIVIQIGSTLTTAAASKVVVENGDSTDGVFFQVGTSATLGAGTMFAGNILALASVSFGNAADILCGRAFALTGAVSTIDNTVSDDCFGAGSEGSGISDFGSVGYSGGAFDEIPPDAPPVPEPSTFVLALGSCGLIGAAVSLRTSRRGRHTPTRKALPYHPE